MGRKGRLQPLRLSGGDIGVQRAVHDQDGRQGRAGWQQGQLRNRACAAGKVGMVCNRGADQHTFGAVGSIVAPACTSGGNLINAATESANFDPGASSSIILMTACYSWEFGGQLPFFQLGNLNGGAYLIQASAAFRTEPYN